MSKADRGFASMDPERVREIARMGGRAAQDRGVGHRWTSTEAQAAGRKGGLARKARRDRVGIHNCGIGDTAAE